MKVTIVYSEPSKRMRLSEYASTDEDTAQIAKMVQRGLCARNYQVEILAIDEDQIDKIARLKTDCVFNLIEWCGRDIELSQQAFLYLKKLNVPVTGANEKLYVLTGDKLRAKQELKKLNILTPIWQDFRTGKEKIDPNLLYPLIVKPSLEHCSMGITGSSVANSKEELREIVKHQISVFEQPVIAEEFIRGREMLVYLLENRGEVTVLPIEEVIFAKNDGFGFQTYETKWVENSHDYQSSDVIMAKLSSMERMAIEKCCIKAFCDLGLWGYARCDIRLRDGIPYILEVNANPSVYDTTEELEDIENEVITGIKFPDYLKAIVESAEYHYLLGKNQR